MSTELRITNFYGTFKWSLPEYGGPASELARACFAVARAPYEVPIQLPDDFVEHGSGPNCPKCGGESRCTWLRAGETKTGKPELWGFGDLVGNRKERYAVRTECLLRSCACGYEWLGGVL